MSAVTAEVAENNGQALATLAGQTQQPAALITSSVAAQPVSASPAPVPTAPQCGDIPEPRRGTTEYDGALKHCCLKHSNSRMCYLIIR